MRPSIELDSSQEAVASTPPQARQIVLAGPGAGKTEVISALGSRLVEAHKVYPEEIWVVSFSRAAVDAVRDRTTGISDAGVSIEVLTFDSLAAQIVKAFSAGLAEFRTYDETIRKATAILANDGWEEIENIRHLVIDEVQDIAGIRADFALEILKKLPEDAGFTLLGDPAQALYDFQVSPHSPMTVETFLQTVRNSFSPTDRTLDGEYRARSTDAHRGSSIRSELLTASPPSRLERLTEVLAELVPMGALDAHAIADISAWKGSTALLCDTNARAALVYDRFMAEGVPVELAAGIQSAGIAPWVARLAYATQGHRISRDRFLEIVEGRTPDPGRTWLELVHLSRSARELDLAELAHALVRNTPRALLRRPDAAIVASTVHRAKGLEFDNVVMVDVDEWRGDQTATPLANQVFVALTRARSRLTTATGIETRRWSRQKNRTKLWVEGLRGGLTGVILEAQYAHAVRGSHSPSELEEMVGRAVTWTTPEDRADADGAVYPMWTAVVDLIPIASTTIEFGRAMAKASFTGGYPHLYGGWVEGVETKLEPGSLEGSSMWIGARVSGPLSVNWRK